jgi:hypothetical protein
LKFYCIGCFAPILRLLEGSQRKVGI